MSKTIVIPIHFILSQPPPSFFHTINRNEKEERPNLIRITTDFRTRDPVHNQHSFNLSEIEYFCEDPNEEIGPILFGLRNKRVIINTYKGISEYSKVYNEIDETINPQKTILIPLTITYSSRKTLMSEINKIFFSRTIDLLLIRP
ncbi:hypothetical protein ACOME3_009290 [Neoechinorhynchus agilis]